MNFDNENLTKAIFFTNISSLFPHSKKCNLSNELNDNALKVHYLVKRSILHLIKSDKKYYKKKRFNYLFILTDDFFTI